MKRLIFLITILLCCSCSEVLTRNTERIGFMNAIIFQVMDSNEALVMDRSFNVAKIITTDEVYYDGRHIRGYFILVDTYAYVSADNKYRVVPVYVRYSEYKKYSKL